MLTRDQILAADSKLPTEEVNVPEWGGTVIVSVMSGSDRDAWEAEISRGGREGFFDNARARLVVFCLVDQEGRRIFSKDDVELLGRKSWVALQRVADVAQRLNKLTKADIEDIKGN